MMSSHPLDQNLAQSEFESQTSRELAELSDTVHPGPQDDRPLREAVEASLARYFDHLDGSSVTDLYAMVMAEVEAPLLASVLEHTQGNQTRAAEMLGLNRGTLRKKLKQYGLI
ncbi:DNA-binding transcriptional regulator Fis [Halomonas saccharevitans]|uniref:Putative Fis-like DNA-binding protein n=1 Tax=Halomonas saccharevitans TaxID=416872 RepID=A0A1I7APM3_9GAMM|nr:DNA-binding transcriptional regulator Fis [Halomonas saccharevitans]MDT8878503.1 DNA-binding transcriptional regulator Fis [Halomonas saccharevitans]SFT76783.1 Fis family transcriptional regulator, factor for inversion stimulation protein [Halomonas saccharevitans]